MSTAITIVAAESRSMYERCTDCDHAECSLKKACETIERQGGSKIQKLARAALSEGK